MKVPPNSAEPLHSATSDGGMRAVLMMTRWMALRVAVLCVVAFVPVFGLGFVAVDDPAYVAANPIVRQGISLVGIKAAFTSTMGTANWHPVTWLSLMLDAQLWGSNPFGYHLTALLLHLANTLLLGLLLSWWTGSPGRSWIVAAIFAIHPLRVESVAWVSERKDVLFMFFGLLTLLAYGWYASGRSWRRYVVVAVLYALCLLSKPMLVTLPVILFALDFWPLNRWRGMLHQHEPVENTRAKISAQPLGLAGLIVEKIPLVMLAGASCLLTIWAQSRDGAILTGNAVDWSMRLTNTPVAYLRYIAKHVTFWDLSIFYPFPEAWPLPSVFACVIALGGLGVVSWMSRRDKPWLLTGYVWYVVSLLPVIGLVQVGSQSMADRYTYFPCVGLLLIVVWSWPTVNHWPRGPVVGTATLAVLLPTLAWATSMRCSVWRDDLSHARSAVLSAPNAIVPRASLASVLINHGMIEPAHALLEESLPLIEFQPSQAIWLAPRFAQIGDAPRTAALVDIAVRALPKFAPIRADYGMYLVQNGQPELGLRWLLEAETLDPRSATTQNNLGYALAILGRVDESIPRFTQALRSDPYYLDAARNLGSVQLKLGQWQQAHESAQLILRIDPDNLDGHALAATALTKLGDTQAAQSHLQRFRQLAPAPPTVTNPQPPSTPSPDRKQGSPVLTTRP